MLYDILELEKRFSGLNKKIERVKKIRFPKKLTHGFSPKMAIFPTFLFLGNIGQENVFYDIVER